MDTPVTAALTHFLDTTTKRQALISGNIANADTPGYKTLDFDFQRVLSSSLEDGEIGAQSVAQQVAGLIERPDGNNVSLDREGLLLAQTQLQFSTGIQLLRSQFQQMSIAINEGK